MSSRRVHIASAPRTGLTLVPQSKQDGIGPVPSPQTLAVFTVGQPWALIYLARAHIKVCVCKRGHWNWARHSIDLENEIMFYLELIVCMFLFQTHSNPLIALISFHTIHDVYHVWQVVLGTICILCPPAWFVQNCYNHWLSASTFLQVFNF